MAALPESASAAGTAGQKEFDVTGATYTTITDKDGFLLYSHDRIADGALLILTNLLMMQT